MIQLVHPARGRITQPHGAKQLQDGKRHAGQDYGYFNNGVVTDEVFAAADGVVLFAGDSRTLGWPNLMYLNPDFNRNDSVDSSAGNYIIIQHHENKRPVALTGYAHLAAWTVKAGDKVKAGQRIATIGNTGYSFGKHLHFDFMTYPLNYGTETYGRVDPNPYFVTGLAAAGATTPQEEEDVALTPDQVSALALIPRMNQILEALETDNLRAVTKYVKGDGEDTLYEIVEETGQLRGITLAEWQASGRGYRTVPQSIIDALPKAG